MLTLEETLADQTDLHKLCADRELKTNEIFTPNAFYGYDFIFKEYAGLPHDYPLKVVLPHGVSAGLTEVWDEEFKTPLPVIFAYSKELRNAYLKANKKTGNRKSVVLSATPLLYLLELLKNQPKPERKGTIFFPGHSSHYVTAQMDFEALTEELLNLDEEYQPVTVCIYWRDFNLGHHLPFQKRGMQIVSAGHAFDPYFLFRFYHLCSTHHYSSCNAIGSHVFYSIKSGCSYFFLDSFKCSWVVDSQHPQEAPLGMDYDKIRILESLFKTPKVSMIEEQMKVVDSHLGAKYFKSPQKLRKQLLHAETLYNKSISADQGILRYLKPRRLWSRFKYFLR